MKLIILINLTVCYIISFAESVNQQRRRYSSGFPLAGRRAVPLQHRIAHSSGLQVRVLYNRPTSARNGPNTCGQLCCEGWKLSSNGYCTTPICIPQCENEGICAKPNKCKCTSAFYGQTCSLRKYTSQFATSGRPRNGERNRQARLFTIFTQPRVLTSLESRRARTCLSVTCLNGGGCLRGRCICPKNFTGPRCGRLVPKITPRSMLKNKTKSISTRTFPRSVCRFLCKYGKCVAIEEFGRSKCTCYSNYKGVFCDVKSASRRRRPRVQRYSPLKRKRQLGKCYMQYNSNRCSQAHPKKVTAKACCRRVGQAWGPRCTSCSVIRGFKTNRKSPVPALLGCPRGFARINGACLDVNECSVTPRCMNGRCVNTRGSYRCSCNGGFYLSRTKQLCLPNRRRIINFGRCHTNVNENGTCPNFGGMFGSKSDCCCSVGVAWGIDCVICPPPESDERLQLCPFGSIHSKSKVKISQSNSDESTVQADSTIDSTTTLQTTTVPFVTEAQNSHEEMTSALYRPINTLPEFEGTSSESQLDNTTWLTRHSKVTLPVPVIIPFDKEITTTFATPEEVVSTQDTDSAPTSSASPHGSTQKTMAESLAITSLNVESFSASVNPCNPNPCKNEGVCHSSISLEKYSCLCSESFNGFNCEQEKPTLSNITFPTSLPPATTTATNLKAISISADNVTTSQQPLQVIENQPCYGRSKTESKCSARLSTLMTPKRCCCSIGVAWGTKCSTCPRRGSKRYKTLCAEEESPSTTLSKRKQNERTRCRRKCLNGACVKHAAGFTCLCRKGYQWNFSTHTCEDVNECNGRTPSFRRCNRGMCVNTNGSFKCKCFNGWKISATNPAMCVRSSPSLNKRRSLQWHPHYQTRTRQ